MQKLIKYIGEVLPDGHLSVPEEVHQTLASMPHTRFQITIRLLQPETAEVQAAWTALRQTGQDATPGRLSDASVHHDRYLYGKDR
jgi:hypothetical protein